ncbi:MAG: ATP-grasp domain-containing protein [Patescibacteria group bacterium]|jgi:RimK family alpha-L-glutamate ligase
MKKIAVFYGGKLNSKVKALKIAADREAVGLDLINYREVGFRASNKKVGVFLGEGRNLEDYGVVFFRSAKNHWEEVSIIVDTVDERVAVVDPVIKRGRPSDICKIYQMRCLTKSGLRTPKTVMGDLRWLRENSSNLFKYPMILKGSRGDRRSQVFKFYREVDWDERWEACLCKEKQEGQRYMLQEYIENNEDYRVMVVGDKVLGVMKRAVGENERLKNVFSQVELPKKATDLAAKAARVCGVAIAGVDLVYKQGEEEPLFWEVNKTPNYSRFMEVTGIDVAGEIVKYLASLVRK